MAIAPEHSPSSSPADDDNSADFGANDWLLQEMYEQYSADPDSVDPSWAEFFESHGPPTVPESPSTGGNGAVQTRPAGPTTTAAPRRAAQQPDLAQNLPAPEPSTQPERSPSARRAAGPVAVANSGGEKQLAPTSSSRRQPTVERPIQVKEARPAPPGARGGVPADPPNPSNRPDVDLAEPARTVLRGAPARTAKNMDISLSVPTATSVRSLPVKLLIDQRVVINNHLRRARGGKVSYTHIIGYAMVRALETVPEMNNGYEMVDGKPTMVVPAHVNLGLAIDMPKPDGTRQLLVPSIKSCERLDFAQFWTAYEEMVKKARAGSLTL